MTNIKITELDFDIIKENLKDFLRGQEEFKDYDFDGSGLQILLDILSANTHYNAIYQNMIANEMFLDSAVLRESVVSRSKVLGYVPASAKASQIEVSLSVVSSVFDDTITEPSTINLPEYSNFTATKDSVTYIFQNTESVPLNHSGSKDDGRKIFSNTFTIKQGVMVEEDFIINYQENPDQRFILQNENVDISTLVVRVTEDGQEYSVSSLAENVVDVGSTDNVYWVNENETGKYELFFGNGRIGKKLIDGSQIKINYLTTSGSESNNIKTGFSFSDSITVRVGDTDVEYTLDSITNSGQSFGGSDKEGVEDIRFTSSRFYQMQNRAVTTLDYKYLIKSKYQNVDSIKVWGGEDNDPPSYGKVFVSLKPKSGFLLTESAKKNITDDIVKKYNVVTIQSEIVDPIYTHVDLVCNVKYNVREYPAGENSLRDEILNSIKEFNSENLGKFDSYLRFSKLLSAVDSTSSSVKSNNITVKIREDFYINLSTPSTYDIKLNNELILGSLESSEFTHTGYSNCFLEDDSNGKISIKTYVSNVKITVVDNIGSIDYLSGKIKLINFAPTFINDGTECVKVISTPKNSDISPVRNQIIIIDESTININMENISEQFLTENRFE
jgi:hypothetical protein